MIRLCVPIAVTVESPFLFPALQAGPFRADAVGLRDSRDRAILPGDQLRGVLRAAMAQMYEETGLADAAKVIEVLFGPAPDQSARSPADQRGALVFSDLVAETRIRPSIYAMVTIDEDTGAAKTGYLQQIELLFPAGQSVTFKGKIEAVLPAEVAKVVPERLKAAASRIASVGAKKSAGFGFVSKVQIDTPAVGSVAISPRARPAERVRIAFCLDRPFIVNAQRIANNVFQSADVIPGGTIKGALARKLAQAGHDPRSMAALSALHIGHARPCRKGQAKSDRVVPMSVVHLPGSGRTSDFLAEPEILTAGTGIETQADWKPDVVAGRLETLGLWQAPDMVWQARAHVRIGSEGTAEDGMLFFTNAIDPADRFWDAVVDFSNIGVEDAAMFWGALHAGLDGIGSTNARLEINAEDSVSPLPARPLSGTSEVIVTLETDGILGDDSENLSARENYRRYWKRVLGAELVDFAARQDLRGGYLGHTFAGAGAYKPFRVTCAGSAFRLRGHDPTLLSVLLKTGLPAPIVDGHTTNWRTCPFQPENGWGEIRADWGAKGEWP